MARRFQVPFVPIRATPRGGLHLQFRPVHGVDGNQAEHRFSLTPQNIFLTHRRHLACDRRALGDHYVALHHIVLRRLKAECLPLCRVVRHVIHQRNCEWHAAYHPHCPCSCHSTGGRRDRVYRFPWQSGGRCQRFTGCIVHGFNHPGWHVALRKLDDLPGRKIELCPRRPDVADNDCLRNFLVHQVQDALVSQYRRHLQLPNRPARHTGRCWRGGRSIDGKSGNFHVR